MLYATEKEDEMYVIVRTYSAGVHAGELVERNGKEVLLKNAQRIWSWKGRNTLHEIALEGVGAGSKVSKPVASVTLLEAIEIIEATKECAANLAHAPW